jgi:V8-like Glu-specific endopeptidase
MTTDQLIDQIAAAANAGNWQAVQHNLQALKRLMSEEGRPLASSGTYRLVEALSDGAAHGRANGPNPYMLVQQIDAAAQKRPVDRQALQTSWDSFYGLLANPTVHIESPTVHEVLRSLKTARVFDLLAKSADRAMVRNPEDILIRCLYGQALIDSGQTNAGIDILSTVIALPSARASEIAEAHGLLGRAHKQLYVDHAQGGLMPPSVRALLKPHLERAIEEYARVFSPDQPRNSYWHGINLVSLLALARADGLRDIKNPTGLTTEELARRIVTALEPEAESTDDAWIPATLGEAHLALGDYAGAAKYYGAFVRHSDADTFKVASAVRQLEEVWRLTPTHGGGGSILAVLKEAQIAKPDAKFSLPGDSLRQISSHTASTEHQRFKETMVPGGGFVKLAQLQLVVSRAAAVAAICDATGRTMGTGFLLKGEDLNDSLRGETVLLTNAHVMSDPNVDGAADGSLDPTSAIIVLEGADRKTITCDPKVIWQSPIAEHDATLVRVNSGLGNVRPLPLAGAGVQLAAAEPDADKSRATKVSVIGYPLGGPLSLSTVGTVLGANGTLVDMGPRKAHEEDPVYLHYHAPTEPGNSGSPVFETDNWTVIGLHHMGFDQFDGRPRLRGRSGMHHANEGIDMRSIKRALAKGLKGSGWLGRRRG